MTYNNNVTLKVIATTNSGRVDLKISNYEWNINNILQSNNTDTLIIDTANLLIGDNTLSLRVQNSVPCNKWSDYVTKIINIIKVNKMEKTVNVVVDQPVVSVIIVMDTVGRIDITVNDTAGTPIPGATIDLDNVSTGLVTDVNGKTSILNVPYGTHTIKATKV